MWKEQLKRIKEIERTFGEELNTGVTPDFAKAFISKIETQYKITIPSAYKEFLLSVDGYDFNGYCIYGTSEKEDDYLSMVGQNKMFHDNANLIRYWFYGTSDSSWYVYDSDSRLYLETDASETVWNSYATFDELLTKILGDSIGE